MSQGDKRLIWNLRERIVSADLLRAQALAAAEKAGLLRSFYNDVAGDWWSAGGLETPVVSSSPSLAGDVYGGLMVQPDNAAYYLVTPGAVGVLEPSGLGADDNPYRVIVDPGVATAGVLPFTSNAAGASPRWDVIECQPADRVLEQQTRDIYNPATGVASPVLVDKVSAGQLNYRVRVGTVGAGFPGVAAGWLPLSVACVPAGSSSLLTSDLWDVRPLVRERVRPNSVDLGGPVGSSPVVACEYRHRAAADAVFNQWVGTSESVFNGYQVGGILDRSTPSTLAQFGSTAASGGRAGVVNGDLADNKSTFSLTSGGLVYVAAVFPALLPRWQRYSQVPVGSGRVPSGPRGILLVTTTPPAANGLYSGLPMPTAAVFGGGSFGGCMLAAVACDTAPIPRTSWASGTEHWVASQPRAGTVAGTDGFFLITPGQDFPASARRVLVEFIVSGDNTGGQTAGTTTVTSLANGEAGSLVVFSERVGMVVSGATSIRFQAWIPIIPRTTPNDPSLPATQKLSVSTNLAVSASALTMTVLAWSSSDR